MKYISIVFLSLVFLLSGSSGIAQRAKKSSLGGAFGGSQWYIGLETGLNFTKVQPLADFQEFYRPSENLSSKAYNKRLTNSSQQIGIKAAFSPIKQLNISLAASYMTYSYGYQQQFIWENPEAPDQHVTIHYDHTLHLSYLELPLIARYHLLTTGKFRPYLLGGGYYGRLIQADKQLTESGMDRASGGNTTYTKTASSTFVKDMFLKSQLGYLWGGGFAYQPGTLTITVDIMHKQGVHNITDVRQRFSAARALPGFGNVQDDLKLSNLQVSVSLLFPLKFLTKSFKPVTF